MQMRERHVAEGYCIQWRLTSRYNILREPEQFRKYSPLVITQYAAQLQCCQTGVPVHCPEKKVITTNYKCVRDWILLYVTPWGHTFLTALIVCVVLVVIS